MPRLGRSQPFPPILKRGEPTTFAFPATASARAVLSAAAERIFDAVPVTAEVSAVVTATATAGVARDPAATTATATVVLLASAVGIRANLGSASARALLTATARCDNAGRSALASATAVLKARARCRLPGVDFGDDYLGRFQQGTEVPLLVVVRNRAGAPADPTTATPTARVYSLAESRLVAVVPLVYQEHARLGPVYALSISLTAAYVRGRYGVLYTAPTGGFTGSFLGSFEVVAGGDPAGAVVAAHVRVGGLGDELLAELDSGVLVLGTGLGLS